MVRVHSPTSAVVAQWMSSALRTQRLQVRVLPAVPCRCDANGRHRCSRSSVLVVRIHSPTNCRRSSMDERCASNAADAGSTPVGGAGRCDAKADIAVLKTASWWFESTHRQSQNPTTPASYSSAARQRIQRSIAMMLLMRYRRCGSPHLSVDGRVRSIAAVCKTELLPSA